MTMCETYDIFRHLLFNILLFIKYMYLFPFSLINSYVIFCTVEIKQIIINSKLSLQQKMFVFFILSVMNYAFENL